MYLFIIVVIIPIVPWDPYWPCEGPGYPAIPVLATRSTAISGFYAVLCWLGTEDFARQALDFHWLGPWLLAGLAVPCGLAPQQGI